jgi:hypothetical protein
MVVFLVAHNYRKASWLGLQVRESAVWRFLRLYPVVSEECEVVSVAGGTSGSHGGEYMKVAVFGL